MFDFALDVSLLIGPAVDDCFSQLLQYRIVERCLSNSLDLFVANWNIFESVDLIEFDEFDVLASQQLINFELLFGTC